MSMFAAGGSTNPTPPARRSTTVRGSKMGTTEGAGVETGLSMNSGFSCDEVSPSQSMARNPMTGNATERVKTNPTKSKGSHHGHGFEIC